MDPITIITGISMLVNIWQTIKKRQYKKTLQAVTAGVEVAAQRGDISPKNAIAIQAGAAGVSHVLNAVLDGQHARKKVARHREATA